MKKFVLFLLLIIGVCNANAGNLHTWYNVDDWNYELIGQDYTNSHGTYGYIDVYIDGEVIPIIRVIGNCSLNRMLELFIQIEDWQDILAEARDAYLDWKNKRQQGLITYSWDTRTYAVHDNS